MSKEADTVEIALIEKRLAEVFALITSLRISLAQTTKTAIDEGWSKADHDDARRDALSDMEQLRLEIHTLTDRLVQLRRSQTE